MSIKRFLVGSGLVLCLTVNAFAATTPVEMLRDMFRRPVTEWKQVMSESKPLLDDQFFQNVERRIRWGIENNHIDDAIRFAMVGDFAAELKNRPASYRIDLAELFFKAENYPMTGQLVTNIVVTSPEGLAANKARFLEAELLEMSKDLFQAHEKFVDLAKRGYEPGECWFRAGKISMFIQEEDRGVKEWENAVRAGHVEAGIELEKYKRMIAGNWDQAIPVTPDDPNTDNRIALPDQPNPNPPAPAVDHVFEAEVALQTGELDSAWTHLQEAYKANSQDPKVVRLYASTLYRMGNLEEAKAFLDTAVGRFPQDAELLRYRANTEERMYDRNSQEQYLRDALRDYTQAMKLAPNHEFLSTEYARAQAKNATSASR